MTDWIDVKERFPVNEFEVIVSTVDGAVTSAYLEKTHEGYKFFRNGERLYNVTHWMPFPAPPIKPGSRTF